MAARAAFPSRSVRASLRAATCTALVAAALTATASAQPSRVFVASTGNDTVNAGAGCTRALPCRSFFIALFIVAAGGEVIALDSAGYGRVHITKSVTITGEGVYAGSPEVSINAPGARVTLRHLNLVSRGATSFGLQARDTAAVHLEQVVISGFEGYGMSIVSVPSVVIRDSVIRDNQSTGIFVANSEVTLDRVRVEGHRDNGILVEDSRLVMRDTAISGSGGYGLWARDSTSTVIDMEHCQVLDSGSTGILAGAGARIRVSGTRVAGNLPGLSRDVSGILESFGDNLLAGNPSNGSFSSTLPRQ
jgi:hypothetical protein